MKIIDAHMHLFAPKEAHAQESAKRVGHENSIEHLHKVYEELGIVGAVVMSNRSLDPARHDYPSPFRYCIGLDSWVTRNDFPKNTYELVEENLARPECCGIKLYPGYEKSYITEEKYKPLYHLAEQYQKPVAVHMGLTAYAKAHLKYSHPMVLDEVAADYPKVKFVLCHFGNPFLESTVAVIEKNRNVYTDLSGLIEGRFDVNAYFEEKSMYTNLLSGWLTYLSAWDRVLFGTDFPIVNLEEYITYISRLVPEQYHDKVFFENANLLYQFGL
ncbi:MAG: amidohydrolase family protein [Eubacteriales bacterium]